MVAGPGLHGDGEGSVSEPIFVIGAARSGTVFLGEVLKSNAEVHCVIEHPAVFPFASKLGLNPTLKQDRPEFVRAELHRRYQQAWTLDPLGCVTCSSPCRRAGRNSLSSWAVCRPLVPPPRRYADKSHQHVLNVPAVLDAFPGAKFVHVTRDGRDVVASMMKHRGVIRWFSRRYVNAGSTWPMPWFGIESREHFDEWQTWSLDRKCALRWASWVREGQTAAGIVPSGQWLEVRYEDLVCRPLETGQLLSSFAGVRDDFPALAAADCGRSQRGTNGREDSSLSDAALDLLRDRLSSLGYS